MQSELQVSRRAVLGACVALTACGKAAPAGAPKEGQIALPSAADTTRQMPTRMLGKTGVKVSRIGLGGYHIGIPKEEKEAIRIVHTAIDRGITFLDNAWDYHGGKSEERMGKALAGGYRDKVFLMSKIDGRTREAARAQLEQSLKRLGTDHLDLVQIHEVIRPGDPAACFASGGCIEALVQAKKEGLVRFIGFTGHKHPDIHLAMLQAADEHQFAFDTVQMPLNVMDAHFRSFEKAVLPVLLQKGIGILGMKPIGSGKFLESKVITAPECLTYALNLPSSVLITGCDSVGVLEQAIDVTLRFQPLDTVAVANLLEKTRAVAADGAFETFKTSKEHDSTESHPQWLTQATI